jgi:hypothetical protein
MKMDSQEKENREMRFMTPLNKIYMFHLKLLPSSGPVVLSVHFSNDYINYQFNIIIVIYMCIIINKFSLLHFSWFLGDGVE